MEEGIKLTYSESRTINTGKYENTNCFLSISTGDLKKFNRVDTGVTISAQESEENPDVTLDECIEALQKKVRDTLDKRELVIRNHSEAFVDFDTMKKAPNLGQEINVEEIKNDFDNTVSDLGDDELNKLFEDKDI